MIVREDIDYRIEHHEHLFLIHRIRIPNQNRTADVCVGEAFKTPKGFWEVRLSVQHNDNIGQKLLCITDSPLIALEVLWEKRDTVFWGYLQ